MFLDLLSRILCLFAHRFGRARQASNRELIDSGKKLQHAVASVRQQRYVLAHSPARCQIVCALMFSCRRHRRHHHHCSDQRASELEQMDEFYNGQMDMWKSELEYALVCDWVLAST